MLLGSLGHLPVARLRNAALGSQLDRAGLARLGDRFRWPTRTGRTSARCTAALAVGSRCADAISAPCLRIRTLRLIMRSTIVAAGCAPPFSHDMLDCVPVYCTPLILFSVSRAALQRFIDVVAYEKPPAMLRVPGNVIVKRPVCPHQSSKD
jgi:hypothetical protein